MEDYWDNGVIYEDNIEQVETSVQRIYKLCLEPTLAQVIPHMCKFLFINFIFRLLTRTKLVSKYYCHVVSTLCGVIILYSILKTSHIYIFVFILFSYTFLNMSYYCCSDENWQYYLSFLCTSYLVISEVCFPLSQAWVESRGLHMIVAMKVISIAFDIKKGTVRHLPTFVEYLGYMYCPSTCLFGPWISFNTYRSVFHLQSLLYDIIWIKQIVFTTVLSVLFLTVSNCWAYYLIPQSWKWLIAYQEAFSFRSSHYFISFLSEAAMLISGFGHVNIKRKKDSSMSYEISRPFVMEFPRSLVQVVVYWNIPMHVWLKNYVFRVCKPMGSFFAIIMTYLASSFLHGFNIKLAAVLLSLGFYTYVEYKFRLKLSEIFDACVGANPCKMCGHMYKNHIYVKIVNVMFSAIVIFHLAYLGCVLESSSDIYNSETQLFLKWHQLDYASHILTAFLYIIYNLI